MMSGDGENCMSCGGNDGYGPAPHHTADCYFASDKDVESERRPRDFLARVREALAIAREYDKARGSDTK
jgi:hypothetical protein